MYTCVVFCRVWAQLPFASLLMAFVASGKCTVGEMGSICNRFLLLQLIYF